MVKMFLVAASAAAAVATAGASRTQMEVEASMVRAFQAFKFHAPSALVS